MLELIRLGIGHNTSYGLPKEVKLECNRGPCRSARAFCDFEPSAEIFWRIITKAAHIYDY